MDYRLAARMGNVSGSAIREIFKLLEDPEVISFAGGMPGKESFPDEELNRIASDILKSEGKSILQYGATEGYAPLRRTIVDRLTGKGIEASISNTLILSGSQQGIDLAAKAILDPGDVVLVESPTFLGALQIFAMYQAKAVPLEMDGDGILIDDLERKLKQYSPKLIYLIPTFQNPSGRTLALERRKDVAALASRYNAIIIEDDPYCELRYRGRPIPAIKTFDTDGRVILLNSFSKTISPGLRVGYAVAEETLLRKLIIGKQSTDVHTSLLSQAMVQRYVSEGLLEPHIKSVCEDYAIRLNTMQKCIEDMFPEEVNCSAPDGGLFIWMELPARMDANVLFKKAVERKVAFVPGTSFFTEPGHDNTMRLNFSASAPEIIQKGMEILADVIKAEL